MNNFARTARGVRALAPKTIPRSILPLKLRLTTSMRAFMRDRWSGRLCAAVVACALAASSAWARDFRAADTQAENYPTVQALLYMSRLIDARNGRPPPHPRLPLPPARRGEGDDRADPRRRDRTQPHQCRPARRLHPDRERPRVAVPVPLDRAPAPGSRRPDRRGDPGELRAATGSSASPSTIRGARSIYNTKRPIRGLGGPARPAHARPAIRADGRDDQGARRRADRAALRPGR